MKGKYAPLEFLSQSENSGREFEVRKQEFIDAGVHGIEDMTEKEYVDFLFSQDFMDPDYSGKYKDINRVLFLSAPIIAQQLGIPAKAFESGEVSLNTELMDVYLSPVLLEQWGRNKQVYKPDKDFANALIGTDKLQFTKSQISHLPCKQLYIDLSDCPSFAPIIGTFVIVHETSLGVNFALYQLTKDMIFFSFYSGGRYTENGLLEIDTSEFPNRDYEVYIPEKNRKGMFEPVHMPYTYTRKDTTIFTLQMLCYLTSREPEIEENPTTKKTYRKSAVVKNKFSEVQQWDVGMRYGKTIRTQVAEMMKKRDEANTGEECPPLTLGKERKSPVPHFRCAHWQRYWTGAGRTNCEVRWIEPIFVGFKNGGEKESKDVVIHRVR